MNKVHRVNGKRDEQINKRLDKIEVALIILLDELVSRGNLGEGECAMLKKMVSNRE